MFVYLLLVAYVISCANSQECADFPGQSFSINVPTMGPRNYSNCGELVDEWPYLCNPASANSVAKICCGSCQTVDYSCVDTMIKLTLKDKVLLCQNLTSPSYSYYCKVPRVAVVCCHSCSKVDVTCLDIPAANCQQNIAKHGCLFCEKYQPYCCQSCKPLTPEYCANEEEICRDDPTWKLMLPDKSKILKCHDLTQPEYQCGCKDNRKWCCESCKDVDDNVCRDCAIWSQEVRGTRHSDCSLMELFPYFCKIPGFYDATSQSGHCCSTCARVAAERDLECTDNPFQYFSTSSTKFYCDKLIEHNKCFCDNSKVRKYCCQSCQIDHSDCGCKDLLTGDNTAMVLGEKFSTCKTLLSSKSGYPYFCKEEKFKMFGGVCCKSCEGVNTTCVDEPLLHAPYLNAGKRNCRDLIKDWPYFCKYTSAENEEDGYKDRCCHSCSKVNATCTDEPVFIKPYPGAKLLSCKELAKKWPYYCTPGQLDQKCCLSCSKAKLPDCIENPNWSTTITNKRGKVLCNNCSCRDLLSRKNKKLRNKICCDNIANAKTECCKVCKKAKC